MKKILLIEDNTEIRENIAEILSLANYEIVEAENGKVGVDLAKKETPDLIICDIMMPQLDGYGVLHLLNKNPATSAIPFIFLTAKSEKQDFRKGMNLGADDYLIKPFDDLELLDAVEMRLKKKEILKTDFKKSAEGLQEFIQEAKGQEALNKFISKEQKISAYKRNSNYLPKGSIRRPCFS
jgi:CRP/FNR family transcriptional regulator, polysaccharide utilization system transcription regulator